MKKLASILAVFSLTACVHTRPAQFQKLTLHNPPQLVQTEAGQTIYVGGFSGLAPLTATAEKLEFLAILDRGPNASEADGKRPFMWPQFTPRILKLSLDPKAGRIQILDQILLKDQTGKPLTGLPQPLGIHQAMEVPVDARGKKLKPDPRGIDPESMCLFNDGTIWIGEEYGPDLLKFNSEGWLLERYSPGKGLPREMAKRRLNRGFEGIACATDRIFIGLQGPIDDKDGFVPLVEFDPMSRKTVAVHKYPLSSPEARIGDMFSFNGRLLVLEHDGKNLRSVFEAKLEPSGVKKELILDLAAQGFNVKKAEGLAVFPDGRMLVVSDNDFGLAGEPEFSKGTAPLDAAAETEFGWLFISSPPSDR